MSETQTIESAGQGSSTRSTDGEDYQNQAFLFQLDLLKIEIDLVDRSIARDEERALTVKNLAVVIWAAGITAFMAQSEIRKYVIFTAMLPVLFWFLDAWWTHLRMGTHIRSGKIAEFVNGQRLADSFRERRLVDFAVLNTSGSQYKNTAEFKKWSRLTRIMRFREMIFLYGGLALFSLILGAIAWIKF